MSGLASRTPPSEIGEARIVAAQDRKPIERQRAQAPLTERHRRAFGEAGEETAIERAIETIDGTHHGPNPFRL